MIGIRNLLWVWLCTFTMVGLAPAESRVEERGNVSQQKETDQERILTAEQQMQLSFEAFKLQWEDLKTTRAFQPTAFVPGVIDCLDPTVQPRVGRTVFAYYAGQGIQDIDFELLSHLALAFVDADANGHITSLPLSSYAGWYDAINAAHAQGVRVVLVGRNAGFSSTILTSILRNPTRRQTMIDELLAEVQQNCLDGVSIDFENVNSSDRDYVTIFMRELAQTFTQANPDYHISFAVPPYDWGNDFDYPAIAAVTDALLMMQYVYYGSWSSTAGPQAPIERSSGLSVLDSIQREFLDKGVPASELVQLMPYYGYQWNVASSASASTPGAAVTGLYDTVLINENPFVNMTYNQTIDLRGQYFHYFWTGSRWVQGWCDDSSSIGKKIDLALEHGLQGVGMWRIEYGNGYPELWDEIDERLASNCPNQPLSTPSDRWKLEIWDNIDMSGTTVEQRYGAAGSGGFSFNWGGGSASDCTGDDYYSVRFSRRAYFDSDAEYTFTTTTDDGVRLYVDGDLIIDRWQIMAPTTLTGNKYLTAGWHDIRMDYYENAGGAVAELSWETSSSDCHDNVPHTSWRGEYFSNRTLSGTPIMVRNDGNGFLGFEWFSDSPSPNCGMPADDFSVRWTRTVNLNAGTYRFTITSDDGFRLYVDDALKLEKWIDQGPTTYTVDVPLAAGNHNLKMEYYEHGGWAVAKLSWENISSGCIASVAADRWKGDYFNNRSLSGSPVMVRDDGSDYLNYDWGSGSPSSSCGIPHDNFSVRWTRTANFNAGTYRFTITSDDGFRFYVDNALKLEKWIDQGPTTYTVDVPLTGGNHHLKMEYYEHGGGAVARLSWEAVFSCMANVPSTDWKGEYFGNRTLSGTPSMIRNDGNGSLGFEWYSDSPGPECGMSADDFSVRWTRTVNFGAGIYRFTITSDDGFRLYLDDALKLEKWIDQGPTTYTVDVPLTGGNHRLKMEYYEHGGWAVAKLSWQLISIEPVIIDDGDPGFQLFGPSQWWHPEPIGYGNDMVWTYVNGNVISNKVRWNPSLPVAGSYRVEAHIPNNHATTRSARYAIRANGVTHTATVNQNIYYNQWVTLGTFAFNASNNGTEYVELTDATGESTSTYWKIGFDAMRFVSSTAPPPTDTWAFPIGSADSASGWVMTNGLGNSWTNGTRWYRGHLGEDWSRSGGSLGQPVYSAAAGTVITVLQNCGNYVDVVIIEHQVAGIGEPVYSFYGHIEADGYVQEGDFVEKRQQIGVIGDPVTFGPHLHFEIKNRTALINPPFSSCASVANGVYISAGYSGVSNDYDGGEYYDPSNDSVVGNRYYHPTRFINARK